MDNTQPRYFIGIALSTELSEQLFTLKWQLHRDIDYSLKPLVPHITLLHPSNLRSIPPEESIPKILRVAAPYLPLTFELQTIEDFEREVLYIQVHSPELKELQSKLVELLPTYAQTIYHQRPYVPHITLAQVRRPHTLDIETLRKSVSERVILPEAHTISALSCFTQLRPREYDSAPIQ